MLYYCLLHLTTILVFLLYSILVIVKTVSCQVLQTRTLKLQTKKGESFVLPATKSEK
jgi:hypothetical protein